MECQEKTKTLGGTFVSMITLQFARNSENLKKIQKRDVKIKNVTNFITIFANGTMTARTWKIADFITQKESKQSQRKETFKVCKLEMEADQ